MKLHIFHDWEKWKTETDRDGDISITPVYEDGDRSIPIKHIFYQTKECSVCGKKVTRRQDV